MNILPRPRTSHIWAISTNSFVKDIIKKKWVRTFLKIQGSSGDNSWCSHCSIFRIWFLSQIWKNCWQKKLDTFYGFNSKEYFHFTFIFLVFPKFYHQPVRGRRATELSLSPSFSSFSPFSPSSPSSSSASSPSPSSISSFLFTNPLLLYRPE